MFMITFAKWYLKIMCNWAHEARKPYNYYRHDYPDTFGQYFMVALMGLLLLAFAAGIFAIVHYPCTWLPCLVILGGTVGVHIVWVGFINILIKIDHKVNNGQVEIDAIEAQRKYEVEREEARQERCRTREKNRRENNILTR